MPYTSSAQLSTFRKEYSPLEWETHIENIFECIQDQTLNQDDVTQEEYSAVHDYIHGY